MYSSKKLKNVVLYIRVSTHEQTLGYSIEGQKTELTQYCKALKYNIVNIYIDAGLSGTSMNERIEFKKMINDINNNPENYDAVIVWKLSRISRDNADLAQIVKFLDENDVALISREEGIDTSKSGGKFMAQILGAVAEMDRENIVENAKLGMKQRARSGEWNGGIVLGYKSENKQLIIDEKEAETVRTIFDLYTNKDWGYSRICKYLNTRLEQYPTKRKSSWSYQTIKGVLDNPVYVGKIRWDVRKDWNTKRKNNRENNKDKDYILVDGKHDPIIDVELWERTRQKRELVGIKPTKKVHITYLLSGLPKCPECGGAMVSHRIKKKGKNDYYRYYCCNQWANKKAICHPNLINAEKTEEFVIQEIKNFVNKPNIISTISENIGGDINITEIENDIKIISKRLTKLNKDKEKYIEYLVDEEKVKIIGETGLLEKIDSINKEIELQEVELSQLKAKHHTLNNNILDYEKIALALKYFDEVFDKASDEQKIELLHTIVKEIKINPASELKDRTVKEIILHFSDIDLMNFANKDEGNNSGSKSYEVICDTVHP